MQEMKPHASTIMFNDNSMRPSSPDQAFRGARQLDRCYTSSNLLNLRFRGDLISHLFMEIESLGVGPRHVFNQHILIRPIPLRWNWWLTSTVLNFLSAPCQHYFFTGPLWDPRKLALHFKARFSFDKVTLNTWT